MTFADWWHSHSRIERNAVAVVLFDALILLLTLLDIPYMDHVWGLLANSLPNIYRAIFIQLSALLLGTSPYATGGPVLIYVSAFLTLITAHFIVGALVGFLFRKVSNGSFGSFMQYVVLVLAIIAMHVALIVLL